MTVDAERAREFLKQNGNLLKKYWNSNINDR